MGLRAMFVEHSSTKTNLSETMLPTYPRKALLFRSSRSEDAIDLFESPPVVAHCALHGGHRDRDPPLLLEHLRVLFQGGGVVLLQLAPQRPPAGGVVKDLRSASRG